MRSGNEINRVLNWAAESMDTGSHYPGMSYEHGIYDAIQWLTGESDVAPDEE